MRTLLAVVFLAVSVTAQIPPITGTPVDAYTMRYVDIVVGTGAVAAPGKQYRVHYTGWLDDGKKFDASRDHTPPDPLTIVQGRRQVIAGWETGFEGMKVGGKRRLIIPYQLAYGELGSGSTIPPKARLTFDVELVEVGEPPAVSAAVDVLMPLGDVQSKVLALLKAVPDDKLDWRPAPGIRSFREVFLHIATGNQLILRIANEQPSQDVLMKQFEANSKIEHEPHSKEEIARLISDSFADVRKALENARPQALGRDAQFFGNATTRRGVFTALDVHAAEHLGQLIAYARTNGIRPPWSGGN